MKLYVENIRQAVLFSQEISGQLSDGHWENTRPIDHWEVWCEASRVGNLLIDSTNPGRTQSWVRKDNYALTNKDLLECVGGRMIAYVKIAMWLKSIGWSDDEILVDHYGEDDVLNALEYLFNDDGQYVDRVENISTYGIDKINAVCKKFKIALLALEAWCRTCSYNTDTLKKDLRALSTCMKTVRK